MHGVLFTPQYIGGVKSFMNFIKERFNEAKQILCPCSSCLNHKYLHQNDVEKHLLLNGMSSTYTRWIKHGEDRNVHVLEEPIREDGNDNSLEELVHDDGLDRMLGDLVGSEHVNDDGHEDENSSNVAALRFKHLIEEAKHELCSSCTNFSRLTFVIKLPHVKSYCRITNSAFSMFLEVLSEAFPQFNIVPKSYDEAKKMLRELGLGYIYQFIRARTIVCYLTYKELDNCPVCEASI